jgi:hypothetical protein
VESGQESLPNGEVDNGNINIDPKTISKLVVTLPEIEDNIADLENVVFEDTMTVFASQIYDQPEDNAPLQILCSLLPRDSLLNLRETWSPAMNRRFARKRKSGRKQSQLQGVLL